MATNWLSPAEMTAWRSFITTTGDLLRAIEHELEPFDLDMGDYQLLAMLSEAPERQLRMSDLADALRLTRGGLTRRMEGVVKKKLVSRVQSSEDGRVAFAQMTAQVIGRLSILNIIMLQLQLRLQTHSTASTTSYQLQLKPLL
jgi:DNA-binding MarR family transcriptional regulator